MKMHSNSEVDGEPTSQRQGHAPQSSPLTLLPLVAIIFYEVSGGPFGLEGAVYAGGPFYSVLGFVALPLIWSIPEALMAAELSTMFPENSGYVAWITAAFGPFWGFQEGLWSYLSGVSDNAIYPVLFLSYLVKAAPVLEEGLWHWVFLFTTVFILTYLNYRGLTLVGRLAIVLTACTLLPFVVLVLIGIPKINPKNWGKMKAGKVHWGDFLQNIFWNVNYWDSASTLAGEVADPKRDFSRGLFFAGLLVICSYVFPLLVGLGTHPNSDLWEDGYLETIANDVGGRWLGIWILVSAALSNIGQFEAEMSSDSFQLQGMAERGMLPAFLAKKSQYGTPLVPIVLSSLGVATQISKSFSSVVELVNVLYCMAALLEIAAFIKLRIARPDIPRPFTVPLGTCGCALMLVPAVIFCGLIICTSSWQNMLVAGAVLPTGIFLYGLIDQARKRSWCHFYPLNYTMPPECQVGEEMPPETASYSALRGAP
ncbi:hypothetical protein CYMTET_44972 [Cymbomonas tetramitiformis]|uniref:Polyamine transporter n=1 Tax=Cymbomonas tetramitiformis TaxID=36881 RepID=A0AAE0C0Z2_9CHLO|nr:hypothetical protein CYMTET_44972 [Cymbomonas tetramitiformis]